MCLGCAELARGSSLSRAELTELKERFHSALSKASSIGSVNPQDSEGPSKPYDGDNYFERQKYLNETRKPERYSSNSSYSVDSKLSYSKAA